MSRRCHVTPRADADIAAQCGWLVDHSSVTVAKKFLKAVNQTIQDIGKNPESGSFAEAEDSIGVQLSTRYRAVRGFENLLVYFVVKPDRVRVLRVLHAARRITVSMILDN